MLINQKEPQQKTYNLKKSIFYLEYPKTDRKTATLPPLNLLLQQKKPQQ